MALVKTSHPPMGWNSRDCFGTTVTEAEVLANARFMKEFLLPYGWDTIVVDIDWADPTARAHGYNPRAPLEMDTFGRLLPDPGRFPSAVGGLGFRPLADQIHALGLRFGIHVMCGIPRAAVEQNTPVLSASARAGDVADAGNVCEWNPDMVGLDHALPAAQDYYDSVLALCAQWGVDFIKADDMLWPYQAADIEAFAAAIERCGRQIAVSLSPGRDLSLTRLDHLREHATMWRICDARVWDNADVDVPFRQVRAVYDAETITVYQAFGVYIAGPAAAEGQFSGPFKRERMTWIKPSFLWMMYRCGWASKPGQERVLAIRITRAGFEWALAHAAIAHFDAGIHADQDQWRASLRAPVRVQWDPERDLHLRPLAHRSLQVGLSGEAVRRYCDEWIVSIEDVTDLAHRVHTEIRGGDRVKAELSLPRELPYPLSPTVARAIGASG